jgi:hypothetical protein
MSMGEEKQTGQRGSDLGPAKGTLVSAYIELCKSYNAIDDFRAKLLGFLPLASGTGIFLLLSSGLSKSEAREYFEQFMTPIGVFGFVVTLGLFA